jgi:hypothetical protein
MKQLALRMATLLVLSTLAVAGEVPMAADASVPGATGRVSFEHDRNGNIKYHVETKHLARPDSLTPAKAAYVVWVQPRGKEAQKAGVLALNNNLEGSFRGTTLLRVFDLFITAEDSPTTAQPTGTQVLKATVQ